MPFPNYTKEEIIDSIYGHNSKCRWCKYQDFYAYRPNPDTYKSKCKRIDHDTIRFKPHVYTGHAHDLVHAICSDFKPNRLYKLLYENWTCFDDYKSYYASVNGKPIEGLRKYDGFSFVVKGYNNCWFKVKGSDFINGTMFDKNGNLKAYEKVYYKIVRNPDPENIKIFYPNRIIHEPIDYVEVSNSGSHL